MTETIKEEHARLVKEEHARLTLETQVHCVPTRKEEMIKIINDVVDLDPAFWDFLVGWMSNHHLEEMVLAAKRFREIYKL